MDFKFVDLGQSGIEHAAEMYRNSEFGPYVANPPDFEAGFAGMLLPEDIELSAGVDVRWSLWTLLPREVSQDEIDRCGTLIFDVALKSVAQIETVVAIADDVLYRGETVELDGDAELAPFANQRMYRLKAQQIKRSNLVALDEHCSIHWGGGVLLGPSAADGRIETCEAFLCSAFDHEATMLWLRNPDLSFLHGFRLQG